MTKIVKPSFPYCGNKTKLLPQILPLFPDKIDTFIDLFSGSCVVTANVEANKYFVNDICIDLLYLNRFLQNVDMEELDEMIKLTMERFCLPESSEGYYALRKAYNIDKSPIKLLVLVYHAINSLLRFNLKGEFNAPFGSVKKTYTDNTKIKLSNFIDSIKDKDIEFSVLDFREFPFDKNGEGSLIYVDPPYLKANAQYNGGWTDKEDIDLYKMLDDISEIGYKFVLSNALISKGVKNEILEEWMEKYDVNYLDIQYKSWRNTRGSDKNTETVEILVKNF